MAKEKDLPLDKGGSRVISRLLYLHQISPRPSLEKRRNIRIGITGQWRQGSIGESRYANGRRIIHDKPVQPQRFDRIGELFEIDRLADITVGARLIAIDQIILFD